jgi:hypothetical protein
MSWKSFEEILGGPTPDEIKKSRKVAPSYLWNEVSENVRPRRYQPSGRIRKEYSRKKTTKKYNMNMI